MRDDDFKYSETSRNAYFNPKIATYNPSKDKNIYFSLVGSLARLAHALPYKVHINFTMKRKDNTNFTVPIIMDWGKSYAVGITDKAAMSFSGPDFEKNIEYIYYSEGKITLREIITFIENCKSTGRRRKDSDSPSYWPKAAVFIAKRIPVEILEDYFNEERIKKSNLHYYLTPKSAPRILPERTAPSSHKCSIKFLEYKEDEGLFEKVIP